MSSFTQSNWDELVSLRREILALRLKVAQLEDVVKQRDSEVGARMTQDAREEATYWHVADPDGDRSWGQPDGAAGGVGGDWVTERAEEVARDVEGRGTFCQVCASVLLPGQQCIHAFGLPKAFSQESDT